MKTILQKINNTNLLKTFLLLLVLLLISYWKVFWSYFQQDEWLVFGDLLSQIDKNWLTYFILAFKPTLGHYVPLTYIVTYIFFHLFALNYLAYITFSLSLHFIVTILLYIFCRLLIGNRILTLFIAALFVVADAGYQATTWPVADINTHGASIFGLLAMIFLLKFIKNESLKEKKFLYLSIISLYISLLFKEITICLFATFPLLIYSKEGLLKGSKILYSLIVIFAGAVYILLRLGIILTPVSGSSGLLASHTQSQQEIIYNFISSPVKSMTQSIIPPEQLRLISYSISSFLPKDWTGEKDTTKFDLFVEGNGIEILSFLFFGILSAAVIFVIIRNRKLNISKVIVFAYLFIIFNSFVFAFSAERTGIISIIDSRNLYFISIGSNILLALLLSQFFSKKILFAYLLMGFIFALNIFWLNFHLTSLASTGEIRLRILDQIKKDNSNIPKKIIFYIESNKSYYGLPDDKRILPFQSGFGQVLLVTLNKTANFPKEFFANKFLWPIIDQGYKQIDGRGFGYFRDFESLSKTIQKNPDLLSGTKSYSFDSSQNKIDNITEEVKGRLEGYLAKKESLSSDFTISASDNIKDSFLMMDNDLLTYWDSKHPYNPSQYIKITLSEPKKIAQLQIKSGNNKDQNQVGYQVFLSNDDKVYYSVFKALKYPPNDLGTADIYFKPQLAKFIKLVQIGNHPFASWIINEISVYKVVD